MNYKDSRGAWATLCIFGDRAIDYKGSILFDTVQEARDKFIELRDPTGILFADKYLGGFDHWKALRACRGLEVEFTAWDEELESRLRCDALIQVNSMASDSFQAAKFMVDRGWQKRGAGRPKKSDVARESRVQSDMKKNFLRDVSRIKRD